MKQPKMVSQTIVTPRSAWIVLGGQQTLKKHLAPDPPAFDPHSIWQSITVGPGIDGADEFATQPAIDSFQPYSEGSWTAGPRVEPGDTLFFYFTSPVKEIHFIATASSEPYLDQHFQKAGRKQWWIDYSNRVQIAPIARKEMDAVFGEKVLLNSSIKYIRPDLANIFLGKVKITGTPTQTARDAVMRQVVGKQELGDPARITLAQLRAIVSGDFSFEEDVERNFLEPLLRLANIHQHSTIKRRYKLAKNHVADYMILKENACCSLIEVKRKISWPKDNWQTREAWKKCRPFLQAKEYAKECKVPFVIMDRDRLVCFNRKSCEPCISMKRRQLNQQNLKALRDHLLGS